MLKPLTNHVVIEPLKEETKTKAGIVIPETAEKEEPKKGRVVAIGKIIQKGEEIKPGFKIGDVIIHDAYASTIKDEKKEYLIIKYSDILAVIK